MTGILLLDKPQWITSHDAVARARRALNIRAIGHAGTLDPMATGLLILCVGSATRLSEYLLGQPKRYLATVKLGISTNTDDSDGEILQQRPVTPVSAAQFSDIQRLFSGIIAQTPPQFSAIKRNGQRAYALARKGEQVKLEARQVTIQSLDVQQISADELSLTVKCTSGTYVRALGRDIGDYLGCGGHLTMIRRTHIGAFSLEQAVSIDHISAQALLPSDTAVIAFPKVDLSAEQTANFLLGRVIAAQLTPNTTEPALCRVYSNANAFLGIGQWATDNGGLVKPVKVLHTAGE